MKHVKEIAINGVAAIEQANEAAEVIRIFVADGSPTFLIGTPLWQKPELWGLLVADLIRHLGNAYAAEGMDRGTVIKRISSALDAEWGCPTSGG